MAELCLAPIPNLIIDGVASLNFVVIGAAYDEVAIYQLLVHSLNGPFRGLMDVCFILEAD